VQTEVVDEVSVTPSPDVADVDSATVRPRVKTCVAGWAKLIVCARLFTV
jgi:hypothetical protein